MMAAIDKSTHTYTDSAKP